MPPRIPAVGLLAGLVFSLAMLLGSPAQAFTCVDTHGISVGTTGFTDCAGRNVGVSYSFGASSDATIVLSGTGPWNHDDPFSDLHVLIEPSTFASGSWSTGAASFFINDAGDPWMESYSDSNPIEASFVANDGSERVFNGDNYSWQATLNLNSTSATSANVTLRYTMDVPEPALAVVLLGGLASLALARRRGA